MTHCLASEAGPAPGRGITYSFAAIDAYVRLLCTLIGSHGGGAPLLAKALSILSTGVCCPSRVSPGAPPEPLLWSPGPFPQSYLGTFP